MTSFSAMDLGLPSGLKWATCNVGANSPEECGDYFAWGEIKPKDDYSEMNSLTYSKNIATCKNRLWNISGNPKFDAATTQWGEEWRMPSKDEMLELITVCKLEKSVLNDKKGLKIIGPNGNSIFLPNNCIYFEKCRIEKDYGIYWTSTPHEGRYISYLIEADRLTTKSRSCGYSIRPVQNHRLR